MAPISFIKISTLIFAYLFLWYQTNDQHQVSALSTLDDDDSISMDNSDDLSSSEEDINFDHDSLCSVQARQSDEFPHESYEDYRPPHLGGEDDSHLSDDTLTSLGEVGSAHSAEKNTPKEAKNVKDKFRRICKKIFCRRARKHRCILSLILGIWILGIFFIPGVSELPGVSTGLSRGIVIGLGVAGAVIVVGLLILVVYLEILYCRARDKYFEKKENNNIPKYSKKKKKEQNNKIKNKLTFFFKSTLKKI
ncbi:hypothetical protein, conserved in P.knowlesi [Plasmodium knowlesi strain H]|uniref:Uncharacterized protein n=3 Tax=Plasmodium knowlesi TaxID=5850 RepID=A0A1A7VRH9_PLAKH|nr:uncharacterized protein PKNH_0712700 [Plasmodium knowlesi strain H]OTN67504.1 Uncharacterized protein PKNOH_S06414200 [Plasmodium knowlesi]CAA9987418.1 hypothetical protein, conserved in P.knowlesi [Plasmodium knowlesi strain H]SBO23279.1 hypothetical protein, conserved in P.knowlesi [Plasmodium knowlesi strain H]SBO24282.1 hypothetical protein, conserved in P.knowlesi [Plasmodium knowlesi strain H]VVS76892.1 hypothetical protein, conserved in P.knowlesi [Plasmodium knowlesi strain H]